MFLFSLPSFAAVIAWVVGMIFLVLAILYFRKAAADKSDVANHYGDQRFFRFASLALSGIAALYTALLIARLIVG